MLDFDPWYRNHGVRTMAQIVRPPLSPVADIELPRKAVLHWPGAGPLDSGPASDELIFKKVTRPIPMWFLPDLTHKQGGPRRVLATVEDQVRLWRNRNRRFRPVRDYEMGVGNANIPFVCNYAFPQRKYAYVRSLYAKFNRFYNVQKTVWDTIKTRLDGDQQHFIIYQLPTQLPPLDILKQLDIAELDPEQMQLSMMQLKYFSTPEQWLIAELWMWAGISRHKTWWDGLKPEQLFKINLIFQRAGQWTVINLGMLNKQRIPTDLELKANPDLDKKGSDAKVFRLLMLRGVMSLMSLKSQADGLPPEVLAVKAQGKEEASPQADGAPVNPDAKEVPPDQERVIAPDSLTVTKIEALVPKQDPATKLTAMSTSTQHFKIKDFESSDLSELDVSSIETELEKDLSALDQLLEEANREQQASVYVQQASLQPDEAIKAICDRLADRGGMTAAEYRRHLSISQTYKSIQAPDEKSTLAEFTKIPQEVLKISEAPKIRNNPNVFDKTMLKSSLRDFDERYIKTVLDRDIASMVLNVQQSGYSLVGYKKERVETITGSYDHYHVKVQPVEGEASVLPFRVPVINEDGVFTSGGVRYTLRKQLTEIPIRKIDDSTVALTSYYGKTFVARSQKRVNDWGRYIRNQVMVKGLDREDPTVSDLKVGRVFQPHLKAPRLYSTLAQDFRGFTAGDLIFNFDRRQAMVLFGQELIDTYEQDGAMLAGKDRHGRPIIIGKDDAIYVGENGEYKSIGTIEQLLQLPMDKVPVDFVELKLMGKTIPLGLVLGHAVGLNTLCRMLAIEPRRVPAGKRVEQSDQEYSLVFNDETLVFNREDRKASLILAGFNEYHRTLRDYSVYEFDRPDVYLNVLETSSLGARYLRELDLMDQMFVDPITRDLLIEMGEPVNFRDLLLRATEMLLLDYFPTKQERTRGYERIAGAVYSELVKAIRSHKGRPGRSRMPVDLNPHAVWQNIARDPSVSLVSDINPIQNLKEQEAITYYGTGGRGSRSMTRDTRVFRESDMGVISESTVDSGDVGVNMYVSADPMWTSLRGLAKPYDHSKKDPTSLLSTSALLAPASDRDDQKDLNDPRSPYLVMGR